MIGIFGCVLSICVIFLGEVSRYRKCRFFVFCFFNRLIVVIEELLVVSIGLIMMVMCVFNLLGIL